MRILLLILCINIISCLELPEISDGLPGLAVFDLKNSKLSKPIIHYRGKQNDIINSIWIHYTDGKKDILGAIDKVYSKYIKKEGVMCNDDERILVVGTKIYLVCVWDSSDHIVNEKSKDGKIDGTGHRMIYKEGSTDEYVVNGRNMVLLGEGYYSVKNDVIVSCYYKEKPNPAMQQSP